MKNSFTTHFRLSWAVDQATTYYLPLPYICLSCSPCCLLPRQIFSKTSKLSYYFYIVKYYVKYDNIQLLPSGKHRKVSTLGWLFFRRTLATYERNKYVYYTEATLARYWNSVLKTCHSVHLVVTF